MSIVSINEITGARTSQNDKGVAEYTRRFKVITASSSVGSLEVRTANGVPRRYDVYATATETDNGSVCTRVSAEQDDENPRLWIVSADYGSPSSDEDQATEPNPVLRPAVLSWTFQKCGRVVYRDINGKPIQNSTFEYFDPPVEIDDSRPMLTITRNELAYNEGRAIAYQDAVNSDSFLGFEPGVVKLAGISAQSQVEGRYRFWAVTYEFEFRREGWTLSILDQGMTRIGSEEDGDEPEFRGQRVPIYMRGIPVHIPVKLRKGRPIETEGNPNDAEYLPFEVYKKLPFSALQLP